MAGKVSKPCSQCLKQWSLKLHVFDLSIVHRPGAKNPHGDALSRRPLQVVSVESTLRSATFVQAQRSDSVLSQVAVGCFTECKMKYFSTAE